MATPPSPGSMKCRLRGHDISFTAHGNTMVWECRRGCGAGGSKTYPSAAEAQRYTAAFDKRDNAELGRNAPLLGMFPLRMWRWWRSRR